MRSKLFALIVCLLTLPSLARETGVKDPRFPIKAPASPWSPQLTAAQCEKDGRVIPEGELPTVADIALDAYCADVVLARSAPHGVVTIFGSARLKPDHPMYKLVYDFARAWTLTPAGKKWPIATGGGPGIMEAGNKGAKESGGVSLSFDTAFGVNGVEKPNGFATDGYRFASFAQRETELVDSAKAIVVAAGGVGTAWELFETLAKVQTGKLPRIPILLLGERKEWEHFFKSMALMEKAKLISAHDLDLAQVAGPAEAIAILTQKLKP